jgi:CRP/FNR family cyclic AMP-dependent transcriptional regulator
VIESGKVKVYCSDKNGKEFIMNTQGSGDYFGELALLDDSARSASVRTVEKSTFCIIYKEDFNRVLDEHPGIGRKLIRNLSQRVRKLTADVKSLALQDVYGRVANVLMDLSEERGDGTLYIPEKLTQQDIADRVGASREMVARILKDLTIGEYIRFEGRHIIINTRLPAKY